MFSSLLTFEMEREVFLKEYSNKTYGILPYFLSKSIVEIPYMFIFPFITAFMVYFSVGLEADV